MATKGANVSGTVCLVNIFSGLPFIMLLNSMFAPRPSTIYYYTVITKGQSHWLSTQQSYHASMQKLQPMVQGLLVGKQSWWLCQQPSLPGGLVARSGLPQEKPRQAEKPLSARLGLDPAQTWELGGSFGPCSLPAAQMCCKPLAEKKQETSHLCKGLAPDVITQHSMSFLGVDAEEYILPFYCSPPLLSAGCTVKNNTRRAVKLTPMNAALGSSGAGG